MGKITLDASKVRKIETADAHVPLTENTSGLSNANLKSGIDQYKASMMNNPEILKLTTDLANDPQIQDILKDPEIIHAITSGNFQALMSNQKFMNLIDNPKVKEIESKFKEQNP